MQQYQALSPLLLNPLTTNVPRTSRDSETMKDLLMPVICTLPTEGTFCTARLTSCRGNMLNNCAVFLQMSPTTSLTQSLLELWWSHLTASVFAWCGVLCPASESSRTWRRLSFRAKRRVRIYVGFSFFSVLSGQYFMFKCLQLKDCGTSVRVTGPMMLHTKTLITAKKSVRSVQYPVELFRVKEYSRYQGNRVYVLNKFHARNWVRN